LPLDRAAAGRHPRLSDRGLFDHDAEQGIRTREQLLKELENEHTVRAGGHFAGHVFGRVLPAVPHRAWASGR